ncbi:hypothetical protein SELMODRAFT_431515 [Selaginella moellendorffii]|uniref:Uncharacterized protein n=1 Tax=Selaginella moellendorffii TaxID=88036 RepID=D8TCX2_SELML|nr:hypothetical protein SELMODRAFT_431515 [Selaginella moellendorffii]
MGWASSVDSDASGPWPPSAASGLYLKEVAPSPSYGIKNGSYKTSNNEYGRFYDRHETPPTKKGSDNYWSRNCDLLHKCNMNCFQQLRKFHLGHWPGFTDDFPITSNRLSAKNRGWLEHKIPWRTNTESGQKSSSKRSRNRSPQDSWKPPEIQFVLKDAVKETSHSTCGIVNRPSDHNSVLSKGCQALKVSIQIDLKSILPFSRSTCIIHFLYSKMLSKRPLTSHGTCGIVNRPSDHNSVLSKGCQALKISIQIDLKSIQPFSRSTCIIHFSSCQQWYGTLKFERVHLSTGKFSVLRIVSQVAVTEELSILQLFLALLYLPSTSSIDLHGNFHWWGNDSSKEGSGRSLYYEADDLFSDLLKDENEGSALTRSDYITFKVTKVHLAGTSLVVSWNEGYVGSSNGVHALKFIPQLLQVYFDIVLQDMSDSLLCNLLPMVFFRINAMLPDEAFSIEVSLSYLFEVVIPKEVKTLQKVITSQPQTSDSKDGVRELFETLELVLYKNLFLWHKTSAIPAQSQLLFFVITIAKLATCHQELLPRARVLRWHNHINHSKRLSGEELKITIAAYD